MNNAKAAPELLEALRAIDPKADLICLGSGFWLLGVHAPNPEALKVLKDELEDDPHGAYRRREDNEYHLTDRGLMQPNATTRLQMLQLYAYGHGPGSPGFKPIELYQVQRPDFSIVRDFQERHHNWLTRPEEALQEMRERVSLEAGDRRRMRTLVDYVDSEAGSWFHNVMRRARRFWQRKAIPKGA